ncbi:MAG TPA: sensor histidine kinase [Candidatus Nanopelagicales bacterium]
MAADARSVRGTRGSVRRCGLWKWQLAIGLGLVLAFWRVVPDEMLDPAFVLIGLYGTASVLVGVRLWRPRYATAWYLVALGVVAYLVGDVIFTVQLTLTGAEPPVPSLADAFYYLMYPLMAASVFLTIRRQQPGRDKAAAIDATLLTTAAAVLSWTYLIAPYANDTELPLLEKLASIGYPLGDLLLVALLARLLLVPGERVPAFWLLVAALAMNLVADARYLYQTLDGTYESGSTTDLWWLLAYVLFGTAAMHPSMRQYGQRAESVELPQSHRRLAIMTVAALSAPALIVLRVGSGNVAEVGVIAFGCVVMFVLVLARMSGLIEAVELQHGQLQRAFGDLQQAQAERQLLLDRTVRAREQERITLAANLHDGPIQRLAGVSLMLDRALLRLDRGDPVMAGELLERGQGELQTEVDALRGMMSELRPPVLDEAGFEAGLRDLVADFTRRTGVAAAVSGGLAGPLESETETALYRVAQEALWNVSKHARAHRVEVRLHDQGTAVELTVADDGVGFRSSAARVLLRDGHFGLVGMRERIESAGGQLLVESVIDRGTCLTARVPRCDERTDDRPLVVAAMGGAA